MCGYHHGTLLAHYSIKNMFRKTKTKPNAEDINTRLVEKLYMKTLESEMSKMIQDLTLMA